MSDRLIELARFQTSTEAVLVRNLLEANGIRSVIDGEAMASWFGNYMGPNIGGVRLRINEADYERACKVLDAETSLNSTDDIDYDEDDDEDFEKEIEPQADSGWTVYRGEPDETDSSQIAGIEFLGTSTNIPGSATDAGDDEADEVPAELRRAWQASIIGLVLCPPLLHIYSMWLLIRHGYLSGPAVNWRVNSALAVNLLVFLLASGMIYTLQKPPEPPPSIILPNGREIPLKSIEETHDIPLVPSY